MLGPSATKAAHIWQYARSIGRAYVPLWAGAWEAPTTPSVRGITSRRLPSSFLMVMRRTLPSRMASLTLAGRCPLSRV